MKKKSITINLTRSESKNHSIGTNKPHRCLSIPYTKTKNKTRISKVYQTWHYLWVMQSSHFCTITRFHRIAKNHHILMRKESSEKVTKKDTITYRVPNFLYTWEDLYTFQLIPLRYISLFLRLTFNLTNVILNRLYKVSLFILPRLLCVFLNKPLMPFSNTERKKKRSLFRSGSMLMDTRFYGDWLFQFLISFSYLYYHNFDCGKISQVYVDLMIVVFADGKALLWDSFSYGMQ